VAKDASSLGYDTMSTINPATFLLKNILEELAASILRVYADQDTSKMA
jgi:hypothetical protein